MNNGKLTITPTSTLYDISTSTMVVLENTGDCDISVGFGDSDLVISFGEGIFLNPGDSVTMTNSDARFGDGTFYAVTKNTANTQKGYLSYSADKAVSDPLTETNTPLAGAVDVAVDAEVVITFSNVIETGFVVGLFDDSQDALAGVASIDATNKIITFVPAADLENELEYTILYSVIDENGKTLNGSFTFTSVAA